jgi:hypothetical protein
MTTTTTTAEEREQGNGPKVWTIDAVRGLGATVDVETAGAILGIGRSKAYELAKTTSFRYGCSGSGAGTSCRLPRSWLSSGSSSQAA